MDLLKEIQDSGRKGKELNLYIAKLLEAKKPSANDFATAVRTGNNVERGVCLEALEYITQTNPGFARIQIPTIISSLSDTAPRVKWEAARVIANIASLYPKDVETSVPGLIENAKNKSTVVRWSAALALGEIAKYNHEQKNKLLNRIKQICEKEENKGVKNVYKKALKVIASVNK